MSGDDAADAHTYAELDELLLGAPRVYTRDEFASRATVDLERARTYWRALGFANVGDDEVAFTVEDLVALDRLRGLIDAGTIDEDLALALTRALGHTMTRLAGWVVDAVLEELWPEDGSGEIPIDAAYAAAEALSPALEELRERSAPLLARVRVPHEPQGHPGEALRAVDVVGVDGDDVGVLEPGDGLGLALEALGEVGVVEELGRQDLEGHVPVERRLVGQVDRGHAAPPQRSEDAERAECRSRNEGQERVHLRSRSLPPRRGWFERRPGV